jgi:hypothetical protein
MSALKFQSPPRRLGTPIALAGSPGSAWPPPRDAEVSTATIAVAFGTRRSSHAPVCDRLIGDGTPAEPLPVALGLDLLARDEALDNGHERFKLAALVRENQAEERPLHHPNRNQDLSVASGRRHWRSPGAPPRQSPLGFPAWRRGPSPSNSLN